MKSAGHTPSQHASLLKTDMNMSLLRTIDPSTVKLLHTASHAVVYRLDERTNQWEAPHAKGTLWVYSRSEEPRYKMLLMNRMNPNNVELVLSNGLVWECNVEKQYVARTSPSHC